MLPSSDALSRLLGVLYDAATNPALWESFLRQLAETARARNAALVIHDYRVDKHAFSRSWNIDPEALRLYGEYFHSIDVWTERGLLKSDGEVLTSQALCQQSELRRTEVYNDYMAPFEFEFGMFSLVEKNPSCFAAVSLYRDSSASEFQESDLNLLRFLTPHLQRAFRLYARLSDLGARATGLEAALEMLPTAVIFLDLAGQVALMNRAARQLLAENDGLLLMRNHLCTDRPSESAELRRLIAEAVSTSLGKGLSPAGSLFVRRKKGLPLQVLVTPVRGLPVDGIPLPSAVVFVNDPSRAVRPAEKILRQLFNLTPGECRVALLIADSRSPREISHLLGVSANTLKTHLSSIYSKTMTSGQSGLVRLLTQLAMRFPQNPHQVTSANLGQS
jgi:DNA-binding CsgD family transcriptional regulator